MNDDHKTKSGKEPLPTDESAKPVQPDKPAATEPSAEEQMAAYEDDLKNTDWGHQPC